MTVQTQALCVRCGRRPRAGQTYLCNQCLVDPVAREEAVTALRAGGSHVDQRRVVIERFHWAGGWGRPDRAEPDD